VKEKDAHRIATNQFELTLLLFSNTRQLDFPHRQSHLPELSTKSRLKTCLKVINMVSQTVTTMEDRILDLLLPFRDECFDTSFTKEEPERLESSAKLERKTLSLARKQDTTALVAHAHEFH
jgi:hypothetical protein